MPDGYRYIIAKDRLFSLETHEYFKSGKFPKKQKRHYMRQKSGFEIAVAKNERRCFMTLSTKYDIIKRDGKIVKDSRGKSIPANPKKRAERLKGLNRACQKLIDNIEYYLTSKLCERACRKQHKIPYVHSVKRRKKIAYPKIWQESRFYFKYYKVKTNEGGGVLHIVFRKAHDVPMIPYKWLVQRWGKIWNSTNVSISEIDVSDSQRLALYMVGQYYAKQPVLRMSYGRRWIGQGIKQRFIHLCEVYGFRRAKEIWSKNYQAGNIPTGKSGFQKRFKHRRLPEKTQGVSGFYKTKTGQTLMVSSKYLKRREDFGELPPVVNTFQSAPWYRACRVREDGAPIIRLELVKTLSKLKQKQTAIVTD